MEGYFWIDSCKNNSICQRIWSEVFCKKSVLKISQNSQENTCARVSFLMQHFIIKNRFFKAFLWNFHFSVELKKCFGGILIWRISGLKFVAKISSFKVIRDSGNLRCEIVKERIQIKAMNTWMFVIRWK